MNAQLARPLPQQFTVEIASVVDSPFNMRQDADFGDDAFKELCKSVELLGVLEPIIVRPNESLSTSRGSPVYELIAGHRRKHAAKAVGLEEIPAVVRLLSDREVIIAQVSENVHRKGLHPLDEARSYEQLVSLGLSTAEIAEQVKKSRRDVEVIIQLLKLCPKAKASFRAGNIDKTRALIIARIPLEKLQLEALKDIEADKDGDYPCSARRALELVRQDFMLELAKAPFDTKDAGLVAAAGACTGCPFNTATQPDLFADLGKGVALCTKSSCFHEKADESWKLKVAERTAKGLKTLTPAESKKVFSKYDGLSGDSGYIRLEDQCRDDSKWRTYKQLLGKSARGAVILARDPKGQELELLPRQGMKQLLRDAGHDFWKKEKKSSSSSKSNGVSPKVKAKQEADDQLRHKTQKALVLKIFAALEGALPIELWRIAAKNACLQDDVLLSQRFGDGSTTYDPELQKEAGKWIEKASVDQLRALVLAICLQGEIEGYQPKARNQLLDLLKIDEKAIKEEVKAELEMKSLPMSQTEYEHLVAGERGYKIGVTKADEITAHCERCSFKRTIAILPQGQISLSEFDLLVDHRAEHGAAAAVPTGKKAGKARRGKEAPAEA